MYNTNEHRKQLEQERTEAVVCSHLKPLVRKSRPAPARALAAGSKGSSPRNWSSTAAVRCGLRHVPSNTARRSFNRPRVMAADTRFAFGKCKARRG